MIKSLPAIPWILDWRTKRFTYMGPQIEQLLGWPRESWETAHNFANRIHPLDRDRVIEFYLTQAFVTSDFETEYSALTISGEFVLIRDMVHVSRNEEGEIYQLIGFMIAPRLMRVDPNRHDRGTEF
nr:PAS domain-containing protein [uncultured Noviherbaspirillum sp.]